MADVEAPPAGRDWLSGLQGQICREESEFGSWLWRGALLCRAVLSYQCLGGKMRERKHRSRSGPLILSPDKMPFLMRGSDLRGKADSRFK